eukprot:CAMPEP_0201507028 /NCGR_PEP_ID=MMETSP0161_2-20130828/832_1 /ASSEMBLY_ACC=CAM_ASM_000251 /TAXON_ID=180227 /ORGANISM="Neoparamoeba aestuarina, Strain SoJaBio B1-5/56/2" /LENGTH=420 /DNA_ID=CAMNT_0047901297 /DNA_START=175 /DNA_END=1437 /DNA_ORIENTATION=-
MSASGDDGKGIDGLDDKGTNGRKRKREISEREKILEKNRQSARDCRRRKKEKVQMLEQQVQELTNQINELQKVNSAPTKTQLLLMRRQAIEGIGKVLKDPEVSLQGRSTLQDLEYLNAKMQPLLHQIHKLIGDKVIEPVQDYFRRIEELLVPMDLTKFIMWGLDQPEHFYSDEKGDGIWELLVRELELTEQQIVDLKKHRGVMGSLRSDFQVVVQRVHEVRNQVLRWLTTMKCHLTEIQLMLTPIQQAKFLWWAEQNMAVLKLIESMWRSPSGAALPGDAAVSPSLSPTSPSSSHPLPTPPPYTLPQDLPTQTAQSLPPLRPSSSPATTSASSTSTTSAASSSTTATSAAPNYHRIVSSFKFPDFEEEGTLSSSYVLSGSVSGSNEALTLSPDRNIANNESTFPQGDIPGRSINPNDFWG